MSFNQSSYQTDEGTTFAAAVVASVCYEGDFDVEIRTMDVSAVGESQPLRQYVLLVVYSPPSEFFLVASFTHFPLVLGLVLSP